MLCYVESKFTLHETGGHLTLQLLIQKVPGVWRYSLENPYPLDNAISFLNTNSLDGDL